MVQNQIVRYIKLYFGDCNINECHHFKYVVLNMNLTDLLVRSYSYNPSLGVKTYTSIK